MTQRAMETGSGTCATGTAGGVSGVGVVFAGELGLEAGSVRLVRLKVEADVGVGIKLRVPVKFGSRSSENFTIPLPAKPGSGLPRESRIG